MKCDDVRQHWHLFHDSEGEAELHLQINEHLEMCPSCARWFFEQSRLEDGIVQRLKGDPPPAGSFWSGIESRLEGPAAARRNWYFYGSAVAVVAACVALGVAFGPGLARRGDPDLAQLSVALHDKLVSGRERVKFASGSHIEVENYLRTQVAFPVRCPPRGDAGFEVRGGGTCKLANDPVAYVVGRVGGTDVSLMILSRDSLPHFPGDYAVLRTRPVHVGRAGNKDVVMKEIDRNLVLVVGNIETGRLRRVLDAYGTYGHGDPARDDPPGPHDPRS